VTLSDNRVAGDTLTASYTTATSPAKNAGAAKSISVSGIGVSGVDSGNYTAIPRQRHRQHHCPLAERSSSGINKVYDGATAPRSPSPTIAWPRQLSTTYTARQFRQQECRHGQDVSVSGIALSEPMRPTTRQYFRQHHADITARALAVSATGVNKVYDGTTSCTVTLATTGIAGDSLATSYASASFAPPRWHAKSVSVSGIFDQRH